jgi:hypothetical protein
MSLKNARALALSLIVLGTTGLGETQENESNDDSPVAVSSDDVSAEETKLWGQVVIDPDSTAGLGADEYALDAAAIMGDTLVVTVSYGGGCEDHFFALDASAAFAESSPVQLVVALAHHANGDVCEAWLTQDYLFDLTLLKTRYQAEYQQDAGVIVLLLEETASELVYKFAAAGETTAVENVSWGRSKSYISER